MQEDFILSIVVVSATTLLMNSHVIIPSKENTVSVTKMVVYVVLVVPIWKSNMIQLSSELAIPYVSVF